MAEGENTRSETREKMRVQFSESTHKYESTCEYRVFYYIRKERIKVNVVRKNTSFD